MTSSSITTFPNTPANALSITRRRSILGIGINDAPYMVSPRINGKRPVCPFYRVWADVLQRCYSPKYQAKYPTYVGCITCPEWLVFSVFRAWMVKQDWQKKQIDKDLIIPGNKMYSPETCLFVTAAINSLLLNCTSARGKHPQGVSFNKHARKFVARISIHGNNKHLGYFETPEEAEPVYIKAKSNHIRDVAEGEKEPLRSALLRHAQLADPATHISHFSTCPQADQHRRPR